MLSLQELLKTMASATVHGICVDFVTCCFRVAEGGFPVTDIILFGTCVVVIGAETGAIVVDVVIVGVVVVGVALVDVISAFCKFAVIVIEAGVVGVGVVVVVDVAAVVSCTVVAAGEP